MMELEVGSRVWILPESDCRRYRGTIISGEIVHFEDRRYYVVKADSEREPRLEPADNLVPISPVQAPVSSNQAAVAKPAPKLGQRRIVLSRDVLEGLIRGRPLSIAFLPDDAKIAYAYAVNAEAGTRVELVLTSEEFPEVQEGSKIPVISSTREVGHQDAGRH